MEVNPRLLDEIRALIHANTVESTGEACRLLDRLLTTDPAALPLHLLAEEDDGALEERLLARLLSPKGQGLEPLVYRTFFTPRRGRPGVVLINDTRTQNNIGCRTTSLALVDLMRDAGIEPEVSITLRELQQIGWVLLPAPDATLETLVALLDAHPALARYRAILAEARLIVVNGEGSFYDRQPKGLITLALAAWAKRHGRARLALVNQSAALSDPVMRRFATEVFEQSDYVSLREHLSLERLPEELRHLPIEVNGDAAFRHVRSRARPLRELPLSFPDEFARTDVRAPFVVLSGSSSLLRRDRPKFEGVEVLETLVEDIEAMGCAVVLLASDVTDLPLLRRIAVRKGLPLLAPSTPLADLIDTMAAASAFISGRWHASILAACSGTPPILGDANFFKTEALHQMLELDGPMFSYATLGADRPAILAALAQIQASGDRLRRHVRSRAEVQAATLQRMAGRLAALAEQPANERAA